MSMFVAAASECRLRYSSVSRSRSADHFIGASTIAMLGAASTVGGAASIGAASAETATAAASACGRAGGDGGGGVGGDGDDDDEHAAIASTTKKRITPLVVARLLPECTPAGRLRRGRCTRSEGSE